MAIEKILCALFVIAMTIFTVVESIHLLSPTRVTRAYPAQPHPEMAVQRSVDSGIGVTVNNPGIDNGMIIHTNSSVDSGIVINMD